MRMKGRPTVGSDLMFAHPSPTHRSWNLPRKGRCPRGQKDSPTTKEATPRACPLVEDVRLNCKHLSNEQWVVHHARLTFHACTVTCPCTAPDNKWVSRGAHCSGCSFAI